MGKTKIEPRKRELFQEMLSIYQPKNMKEFSDMFKDMFAEGMQQALEGELEEELGYSKYDYKNKKRKIAGTVTERKGLRPAWDKSKSVCHETGTESSNHK